MRFYCLFGVLRKLNNVLNKCFLQVDRISLGACSQDMTSNNANDVSKKPSYVCFAEGAKAGRSNRPRAPVLYPSQAGLEAAAHHQGHRGDRGSSLRLLSHLFESELKSCISQASCYESLPTGLNLLQRVGSPQRMAMRVL